MIELPTALAVATFPLGGAAVGWGTNALAIRMLFAPVERRGVGPLRWQGVIPARAERMADTCAEMLLGELITREELYDQIDSTALAATLCDRLENVAPDAVNAVMAERFPRAWPRLPDRIRKRALGGTLRELPQVVNGVIADLRDDLARHLDLHSLITSAFMRDRALLGELFWRCGEKEFRFIVASGFAFGLALGTLQLAAVSSLGALWLLPLLGGLIGGATNWLALRMVFAPLKPVRLGPWRIQGLFVRRQPQVSEAYATFFAERILTPDALLRAVLSGPASSQLVALVERHVSAAMDDVLGVSRPLLGLALGQEGYADLRQAVAARTVDDVLPLAAEAVSEHLDDRLGLQALVSSRLAALAPARFVGVLRPVFQADEWVLTSIGVALGVVAGVVQATLTLAT